MRSDTSILARGLGWLISLAIPLALIGAVLRLILTPAFLHLEYRMPAFPADPYGFSTQDRLRWATISWHYLVSNTPEDFLARLTFQDGTALFNAREVGHMADVKAVVRASLTAWVGALVLIAAAASMLWRRGDAVELRHGLRRGGWLTIGLAAFIGAVILLGVVGDPNVFWQFFTVFHSLFFEGDSWLFAYSDTLIRLFPIRFWQDTFLLAAGVVLAGGLALAIGLRVPKIDNR